MTDWIKTNKMYLLIGFAILVALGIYYFMPTEKGNSENGLDTEWQETENKSVENEQEKEMETGIETNADVQEKIVIDVKGAVTTPGVYEASIGDRVIDIIERAGGLLDSADKNNINFAMKVVDEMVLYIPAVGEQIQIIAGGVATGGSLQEASAAEGKVNLNTASESDLQTLPGIGPSKALAIIEYRETNGSYKSIEELMEISGIGEKTFEKLKEHITVH